MAVAFVVISAVPAEKYAAKARARQAEDRGAPALMRAAVCVRHLAGPRKCP